MMKNFIKLKNIAKIYSGGTPSRNNQDYWNGRIPWVSSSDIGESKINDVRVRFKINELAIKESATNLIPSNSILVVSRVGVGKVAVNDFEVCTSQDFQSIVIKNKEQYLTNYLALYIKFVAKKFISKNQGTSIKGFQKKELENLLIPTVSFNEQKAIADILEKWDEAIEKTSKLIEAKKKRFEWFSRSFFNQKISDNWNKDALEDIGNFYNGLSGKDKNDFGSGKKYLTYMNIFTNSKIDKNGFGKVIVGENENQNLVQKGDIFFTVSSETAKEVGMTSVLLDDIEDCYLNSFCFGYRLLDSSLFAIEYLQYFFRSNLARRQIVRLAQGSTRYNISKDFLSKINLYYPDLPQQKQIAKTLNTAKKEITILEEILANYKNQKKGLMQKLLTGKIRLNLGKEATNV